MKWTTRIGQAGDERVRRFFALIPVSITMDGRKETRWLEMVSVRQVHGYMNYWYDLEFV